VFSAYALASMMGWLGVQGTGGEAMNREPTVVQIVDRIMALEWGESCNVRLDPHVTRIDNLEWLLPICVRQFGTEIAIRERPDGDRVVLTITAIGTRGQKTHPPADRDGPIVAPAAEPVGAIDDQLVAVA
jgi:hypothetical protein